MTTMTSQFAEATQEFEEGNEALQSGKLEAAENAFRQAIDSCTASESLTHSNLAGQARHGLAKTLLQQKQDATEACEQCEAVLAMPITHDMDRRLILDTSFTLTLAYAAAGSLFKAKKLCRLLIDGNRKFPDRVQNRNEATLLMAKLCEADKDTKNAKIYMNLLPAGFENSVRQPITLATPPDGGVVSKPSQSASPSPQPTMKAAFFSSKKGANVTETEALSQRPGSVSGSATKPKVDYYDPYMVNAYDPSLTRAIMKNFNVRRTMDSNEDIAPAADLRNPTHPLSPFFTPFVTVPVPNSAFSDHAPPILTDDASTNTSAAPTTSREPQPSSTTRNSSFFGRAKSAATGVKNLGYPGQNERYRFVRMSRDEYTKYWARDSNGNYLGTEPEHLGAARIRSNWSEGSGKSISQLEYQSQVTEGHDPFKETEEKKRRESATGKEKAKSGWKVW